MISMILGAIGTICLFLGWRNEIGSKPFILFGLASNISWVIATILSFSLVSMSIPLIVVNCYMFYRGAVQYNERYINNGN